MTIPRTAQFHGLTVYPTTGGRYQASVQIERGGGWRVEHGATAREAVEALFLLPVPAVLPPVPVPGVV